MRPAEQGFEVLFEEMQSLKETLEIRCLDILFALIHCCEQNISLLVRQFKMNRAWLSCFQQLINRNARFTKNDLRPVLADQLLHDIQNLVTRQVLNQETIVQAALQKNTQLAFNAFMNDPLVMLSLQDGAKLFREMLVYTQEYLPGWNI